MIRAIIVDDEKPSINMLKILLVGSGKVDVIACFDQSQKAIDYIEKNPVDIAFLDIEMPEINGFELAEYINSMPKVNNRCSIVFVTAYNEYAVEAFRMNALDYLVKPVNKERLNQTLERIINELNITFLPADINFICFDRFSIMVNGFAVKFRTKKAEELVAFLIDKHGKSVTRNEIVDSLWSDFDGDMAIINFNTTLCYARKTLLQSGIDMPIIYENGNYKMDTSNLSCDYFKFMDFDLNDANIIPEKVDYYEDILALYTGDYLGANEYAWAERHRLNVKEKYICLLLCLADYYKAQKHKSRLIEIMKTGFAVAPINKTIVYYLIEALLETGNYSLAMSYYKLYRDAFIKSLHREPDDSFEWLFRDLKVGM